MTLISLFAGVGGFDLGFERAGFKTVGQCEIDPHATSVLQTHWPNTPKHDDVTTLDGMHFGPADVVTFGSPCQDLSVAGKRAGLDGERSGLFLEAVRFIREMLEATNGEYPRWAVWENVPGAFSSNGGDDFAAVLESLVGGEVRRPASGWANAGVAFGPLGSAEWRTLDSQYFGVPQRRRRIFLVYRPGGSSAGEVLLEPDGVPGDPPSRRAPGAGITGALTGGAGSSSAGNVDDNRAQAGFVVPVVADTLTVGANQTYGFPGEAVPVETAPTVLGISQELDAEEELVGTLKMGSPSGGGTQAMVALPIAPTVTASWGHHGYSSPRGDGTDPIVPVASALTAREGKGPDSDATTTLVPVAFALRGREDGTMPEVSGDRTNALRGAGGGSSRDYVTYPIDDGRPMEKRQNGLGIGAANAPSYTLDTTGAQSVATPYAVRRLMPIETERLQGFPDGHTQHAADGSEIADTHRYRMMGNAVSVPVAEWIGRRLLEALS